MSGIGPSTTTTDDIPCHRLIFQTTLASLDSEEVNLVSEGETLLVTVEKIAERKTIFVYRQNSAKPTGTIVNKFQGLLTACIETSGVEYIAIVISVDGAYCLVEIRPEALQ